MRLPHHRRTKAAYGRLHDDPTALFDSCEVILWPNGAPEIWIRSTDGRRSFRLTASDGPAGLAINVERSVGGAPLTVGGNLSPDYAVSNVQDFATFSACQYRPDAWSQAFKAWCADHNAPYPGDAPEEVNR